MKHLTKVLLYVYIYSKKNENLYKWLHIFKNIHIQFYIKLIKKLKAYLKTKINLK